MAELRDWKEQYGRWALVVGGSEGIGLGFARRLAENGVNLVLVARKEEALRAAAANLREHCGVAVETVSMDLTGDDFNERAQKLLGEHDFGTLIYNAGAMHAAGTFADQPLSRALGLLRLNCIGPATLVHALAPGMRARKRGAVILVSSMSGLAGGGYVVAYAAAKAYEIALGEGLWAELGVDGIDVLTLIAGSTRTPSMERAGLRFVPEKGSGSDDLDIVAMDPQIVADEALAAIGAVPVHVAGEKNRQSAQWIRSAPREEVIATMSSAAANMFGLPPFVRHKREV